MVLGSENHQEFPPPKKLLNTTLELVATGSSPLTDGSSVPNRTAVARVFGRSALTPPAARNGDVFAVNNPTGPLLIPRAPSSVYDRRRCVHAAPVRGKNPRLKAALVGRRAGGGVGMGVTRWGGGSRRKRIGDRDVWPSVVCVRAYRPTAGRRLCAKTCDGRHKCVLVVRARKKPAGRLY